MERKRERRRLEEESGFEGDDVIKTFELRERGRKEKLHGLVFLFVRVTGSGFCFNNNNKKFFI